MFHLETALNPNNVSRKVLITTKTPRNNLLREDPITPNTLHPNDIHGDDPKTSTSNQYSFSTPNNPKNLHFKNQSPQPLAMEKHSHGRSLGLLWGGLWSAHPAHFPPFGLGEESRPHQPHSWPLTLPLEPYQRCLTLTVMSRQRVSRLSSFVYRDLNPLGSIP